MMLPVYSTVPGSHDGVTASLSCTVPETKAGNWNSVIINFNYTCAFPTVTRQNVFQERKKKKKKRGPAANCLTRYLCRTQQQAA